MLITVCLLKELYYISFITKKVLNCELIIDNFNISIRVYPDSTSEFIYNKQRIWKEKIEDPAIGFSIESCDTISKIINCINNNDLLWNQKYPSPLR